MNIDEKVKEFVDFVRMNASEDLVEVHLSIFSNHADLKMETYIRGNTVNTLCDGTRRNLNGELIGGELKINP